MNKTKHKLSKQILQMKFMQRTALRQQIEESKADELQMIDDEHWVLDQPENKQQNFSFLSEPSSAACMQLLFGRRSFKGFNPEIEKLSKIFDAESELMAAEEREDADTVTETEMADRYSSLVGTIGKKFEKKRRKSPKHSNSTDDDRKKRAKVSKKFIKPSDD